MLKLVILYPLALVLFNGAQGMDMIDREEQRLMRHTSKSCSSHTPTAKTISFGAPNAHWKGLLVQEGKKKFEVDLKRINDWINDYQAHISINFHYDNMIQTSKTFAFLYYYYQDIKEEPYFSFQGLEDQAVRIYQQVNNKFSNTTDSQFKTKVIESLIGQLFKLVDDAFRVIYNHYQVSHKDSVSLRWRLVESAENIIKELHLSHKEKIVSDFGDVFHDEALFRTRIRQYLLEKYHPDEQLAYYLKHPWEILVQFVEKMDQWKNTDPGQYLHLSHQLAHLLGFDAIEPCYVAALDRFYLGTQTQESNRF